MKKLFLLLTGTVLLFSCSKSSSDESSNTQLPSNNNAYAFFSGTMNNSPFNYHMDDPNSISNTHYLAQGHGSSAGMTQFTYYHYVSATLSESPGTGNSKMFGIYLEHVVLNSNAWSITNSEFDGIFTGIPTTFTPSVSASYVNIDYRPNGLTGGVVYDTSSGSQTGSTINYTSSVAGTNSQGDKIQTVTGTVSCKLYNTSNVNDVITLNNCQFKWVFKKI